MGDTKVTMEVFIKNLKYLTDLYTQKDVAKRTGFSPSSITNYLNGKSMPSALFLLQLKKAYQIDIDKFLISEISSFSNKNINTENISKFVGNYIVYYYNSGAYKGQVGSFNSDILTFGIISITNVTDSTTSKGIKSYGIFMISKDDAETYLQTLNGFDNDDDKIDEFYKKFNNSYYGNLEQNQTQFFISLQNFNDKCLIILNNPPSTKKYIGGLGTVNSISRGREHVPCIQYILLSKTPFNIPDGEIYNLLCLKIPEVNLKKDVNELVNLIKKLYLNSHQSGLTDFQRKRIVEDYIQDILCEAIESNMFRFAKISNMEDDNYYRLIKDFNYE